MQVATQVFPFFEIPNWAVRLVVLLLIIGFPVALILAWASANAISETCVDLCRDHRCRTLSVGVFFLGRYTKFEDKVHGAELPAKSIAGLPFDNLSRDPDNAYFADGIQDGFLTRLSKIADLKVISRTSTQKYKSAPDNLREIARQLGVANILEGSVQKAADQVRVTVQLINALNDSHVWAESYDRKLIDVFQVESDIAKIIADTLHAKLTGSEQRAIAAQPTENTEAHEFYLKGRYFWNKRTGPDLRRRSIISNRPSTKIRTMRWPMRALATLIFFSRASAPRRRGNLFR